MLRGGCLCASWIRARAESLPGWPPPTVDRPVLANWRLSYDRQHPKINSYFSFPVASWLNYQHPSAPLTITATRTVNWFYWVASASRVYIYGGLETVTPGSTTTQIWTAMDSYGTQSDDTITVTVRATADYDARPVLTAGSVTGVSRSESQTGDAVVAVSANKSPVTWAIVSGNPTHDDGVYIGFDIDSSGQVRVDEPLLFVDDPFVINDTYILTIRATDTAGVYGFIDVSVPVSD